MPVATSSPKAAENTRSPRRDGMHSNDNNPMKTLLFVCCIFLFTSCVVQRKAIPARLPAAQLQADFDLFRNILEESHPGLYWYTSKDSMDYYFAQSRAMIRDSMTHQQFRLVLNYAISKMRCGHTSSRLPRNYPIVRDTS